MPHPALEVADIFRDYGLAWRRANAGYVSLDQPSSAPPTGPAASILFGNHAHLKDEMTRRRLMNAAFLLCTVTFGRAGGLEPCLPTYVSRRLL